MKTIEELAEALLLMDEDGITALLEELRNMSKVHDIYICARRILKENGESY